MTQCESERAAWPGHGGPGARRHENDAPGARVDAPTADIGQPQNSADERPVCTDDSGLLTLGVRLRQARQAQRRTLGDVATASELTKGFLSKLENGQVNASVASLVRLCDTLDTPVGSLFEPAVGSIVRADAYPPIQFGGESMTEYVLTPQTERRVQALVSVIEPGGGSGAGHYTLPTEVEFAYVLDGRLKIELADRTGTNSETVVLTTGDAFTFPADNTHAFCALTDDRPTRVLWVFSPALPATSAWQGDGRTHDNGSATSSE